MTPAAVAERQDRHATAYEDHRDYVLAVLTRRCRWLEPDEREVALHDAWAVLLEKEQTGTLDVEAMRGPQVRAYLVQTAINKALDEGRRAGRTRNEPLGDRDDFAAAGAPPEDVVDAGLDGARVREIVAELTARQQTIVKLRFFFDRSPDEIQRLLRITERAYRRDLERAMRVVSERYELVRAGRFCESRASLIRAYVAGIAGPNRAQDARDHIASCPSCRRFALDLREATGRFAATLPLPALVVGGHGPLAQLADAFTGGRETALHASTGVKQQLTMLSARVDPTAPVVASGARPGALAAAVAGCLALSGGAASYCAVVGVPDPVAGLVGLQAEHAKTHHRAHKAEHAKKQAAPPRRAVLSTATRPPAPAPAQTPTATGSASTQTTKAVQRRRAAAQRKAAAQRHATVAALSLIHI